MRILIIANAENDTDELNELDQKEKKKGCCPDMSPFVLMIALSVHSIFEGLALGISTEESEVINMAIAIFAHKAAASLSLGISCVKAFPEDFTTVRWLLFIFAIATPLGVGIGMILANLGSIYDIIFSSLAAGTFVYIGCSEIIIEEFSIPRDKWLKLLFFIIGATFISMLWFIEN